MADPTQPRRVGVVLFDRFEPLDTFGLEEVQAAYDEGLRRVMSDLHDDEEAATLKVADPVHDDVLEELWGAAWPT